MKTAFLICLVTVLCLGGDALKQHNRQHNRHHQRQHLKARDVSGTCSIVCTNGDGSTVTQTVPTVSTITAPPITIWTGNSTLPPIISTETTPGEPGVTTPGEPGVTTPGAPGVTTPGEPGVTTPGAPGVTTWPPVDITTITPPPTWGTPTCPFTCKSSSSEEVCEGEGTVSDRLHQHQAKHHAQEHHSRLHAHQKQHQKAGEHEHSRHHEKAEHNRQHQKEGHNRHHENAHGKQQQ